MDVGFFVQALQDRAELFFCLKRRGEPAFFGEDGLDQPVCALGLPFDIKAGDEVAARFQDAPRFLKCFLLIGERVEAVHADDGVERFVRHRQISDIALHALDVRIAAQPLFRLREHIRAVIQTGDARAGQPRPFALGKHRRPDRDVEQRARKVVGNIRQDLARDLPVVRAAPKQLDVQPAKKFPCVRTSS